MDYASVVESTKKVIGQYHVRMTVRQIYYRLVSPPFQLFSNNLTCYKGFDKMLTRARENADIDWRRIEDRSRGILGGESFTFDSPKEYIDWLAKTINADYFKRAYWDDQPRRIEVWVEKDALASLFTEACKEWKAVVFPSRGYSSMTKVMEATQRLSGSDALILHFTDHDPSGLDMTRDLQDRLAKYGVSAEVKRVALTIEQVRELDLASNPTKKADARSPKYEEEFGEECWELDAVPPDTLTQWIKDAVSEEIDQDAWDATTEKTEIEKQKIDDALEAAKPQLDAFKKKLKELVEDEPK